MNGASPRFFDVLCLCAFHSPRPRILSPVEGTVKLSRIPGFWSRNRSEFERRINNLGSV